jgi:hypothetical protein
MFKTFEMYHGVGDIAGMGEQEIQIEQLSPQLLSSLCLVSDVW